MPGPGQRVPGTATPGGELARMYEVEVELDDGDWLLQAFCTDRQHAMACAMRLTGGDKPRRCRVVALKSGSGSERLARSTVLEASTPHQVSYPGVQLAPGPPQASPPRQIPQKASRTRTPPAPRARKPTRTPVRIARWLLVALALLVGAPVAGALAVYLILVIA